MCSQVFMSTQEAWKFLQLCVHPLQAWVRLLAKSQHLWSSLEASSEEDMFPTLAWVQPGATMHPGRHARCCISVSCLCRLV